jgi:hypothetical protein
MIHDQKKAEMEAQRIANENGAPVWIEYDLRFGAYIIHETPNGMPCHPWIVEPNTIEEGSN